MIKCIIVDDNQNNINILKSHIKLKTELHLIKEFTKPLEAIEYLSSNAIDLIFLDIEMPDLNGLEFIETVNMFGGSIKPDFIITTGFDNYAIKGFEYGVIDYIMKPVSPKRFLQAIHRYLESKVKSTNEIVKYENFFFAEVDGVMTRIDCNEIVYIESSGNYVSLFKLNERVLLLKPLSELEKILNPRYFMRIYKSNIVSLRHIETFNSYEVRVKHKQDLVSIPIGRTYKEEFKKRLKIE